MLIKNIFGKKFFPAGLVFTFFIIVSIVLRIALMLHSGHLSHMQFWQYPASLFIGLLYDVAVAFCVAVPFVLYIWLQNDFIYKKKIIPVVIAIYTFVIVILAFTNIVPIEFNALVFKLVFGYIIFRFVS